MAFATMSIISRKVMVAMYGIKSPVFKKCAGNDLEFHKILASPLASLEILLKLSGVDWDEHQIPSFLNMSSASLQTTRSRPESVAGSTVV